MAVLLDITINRSNKTYYEGELLKGTVVIKNMSSENKAHDGLSVGIEGQVLIQISNKNQGLFEAFYNTVNKPITLFSSTSELLKVGSIKPGQTVIDFEFLLECKKDPSQLYESYHGVFISITYQVKADLKRGFLAKDVSKQIQFFIQNHPQNIDRPNVPVQFSISPESIQKASKKERVALPKFLITGQLDSLNVCLTKPLTGFLTVQHSELGIRSIELQLVRVETAGCAEGFSRDSTEIQNLQITDGNVCPKLQIPIYMLFPRIFTCPTLQTKNFKLQFEINLIIVAKDDSIITENFQLNLFRTQ